MRRPPRAAVPATPQPPPVPPGQRQQHQQAEEQGGKLLEAEGAEPARAWGQGTDALEGSPGASSSFVRYPWTEEVSPPPLSTLAARSNDQANGTGLFKPGRRRCREKPDGEPGCPPCSRHLQSAAPSLLTPPRVSVDLCILLSPQPLREARLAALQASAALQSVQPLLETADQRARDAEQER